MKKLINIYIIGIGLLFSTSLMAQPSNPSSPAPFGFIEILVAAGAAYGGKKLYNAKKEVDKEE